ncbi:MAG: DUF2781 domain-containing protein [Spirochaetes bacterium]|jgi:hypothetical protein|nr:DUF2781 domain-containing protein [Spirochaetota bacterium]
MNVLPLRKRPFDIPIVIFFAINLFLVTYIIDLENLVIADPSNFQYPIWPLPFMVDVIHWWGKTFDPLQLARPPWWRATIWLDAILFGPLYAAGLYAFIKGKEWIRIPVVFYSGVLFANVVIIMFEEMVGPHRTPERLMVWLANLPWLIFPIYITARMWMNPHPFTEKQGS